MSAYLLDVLCLNVVVAKALEHLSHRGNINLINYNQLRELINYTLSNYTHEISISD
jgi:hypothetical protein